MNFDIQDLSLTGIKLISPFYVEDERGSFIKIFERDIFEQKYMKISKPIPSME